MGTPSFAELVLDNLIKNTNVLLVVAQPDKEKDRKGNVIFSPCKKKALENNIEVFQPRKIKEEFQKIIDLKPDIIITCAYGQIIPKELLIFPKYGCINVHASLLPKLRGGAPIHHAIIDGYNETGVTIMYMDEKMDNGDVISRYSIPIDDNITLDELYNKLSIIGSKLLIDTLPSIINGTNKREKQDINEVTFGYNITKEEEHIDFNKSIREVHNQIRGLSSNPGAFCFIDDRRIKIYLSEKTNILSKSIPGTIEDVNKEGIFVSTKDYIIKLIDIQLEGKKRGFVKDLINGLNKEHLIGVTLK